MLDKSRSHQGKSKDVIIVQDRTIDDSMSATSGRTFFEHQASKESLVKLQKLEVIEQRIQVLRKNMQWVRLNLIHHVVNHRSICFVLDSYFEHYKQHQLCKELIMETFRELDDEDFFGLSVRYESTSSDENLDILLEEKAKNVSVKYQLLEKLLNLENVHPRRQGNSYMKQCLGQALTQSHSLPQKIIKFQELDFASPIKWVVVFIGNLRGLLNMTGLPYFDNVNILVVFVTDDTPEKETINMMTEAIKQNCSQGGLMIIRYRETFSFASKHNSRD